MKTPYYCIVCRYYRVLFCAIIVFFSLISFSVYSSPNIPNNFDSWVIETINKLEVTGVTGGFHRHTLPLTREDVAKIIQTSEKRIQSGTITASQIDTKLLAKLKQEFKNELEQLNINESHKTYINLQPEIRAANDKIAPAIQSGLHFAIVRDNHRLNIYSELEISNFEEGQNFFESNFLPDSPIQLKSADQRYERWHWDYVVDFKRSYIQYNLSLSEIASFNLLFGRDYIYWGASPIYSVGISDNSPPFELIRFTGTFPCKIGTLKASAFTAQLNSTWYDDGTTRYLARRFLSAHRIDYQINDWLEIGMAEWVLYGGDVESVKWHYLNPIIPYYAVQYNARKDENLMLCFDASVRPMDGVRLYAEWLADDFQYQSDSNDPHAVTWLTGLEWYPKWTASQLGLQTEYVRVNRWAYTHLVPDNQYTHFGTTIGHPIGTDADFFTIRATYYLTPSSVIYGRISHQRNGEADITDRFYGEDFENIPFPSGIVERLTEYRIGLKYRPIKGINGSINYALQHISNKEHVDGESEQRHRIVCFLAYAWGNNYSKP